VFVGAFQNGLFDVTTHRILEQVHGLQAIWPKSSRISLLQTLVDSFKASITGSLATAEWFGYQSGYLSADI
jgi:hypothetical protein